MTKDARRDPRYQVKDSNLVTVSASRTNDIDDSVSDVSGVLLDLSRCGLRLRLEGFLPKGEEVRLTLNASQFDCPIQSDATIRWAEPDAGDRWIVGCDLNQKIPQESIQELATAGTLERRNDSRRLLSLTADAKTELEQGFNAVQVVDISDGGFRALGGELHAKVNDRLLLRVASDSTADVHLIRARVAWVNDLEGGQSLGCLFLTKADHSQMHAMANQEVTDNNLDEARPRVTTTWAMVGAAVLVIVFVQFFLFTT